MSEEVDGDDRIPLAYGCDAIPQLFGENYTALVQFRERSAPLTRQEVELIVEDADRAGSVGRDGRRAALSQQSLALIAEQAAALLADFYVHLPVKRQLYGIDPVARLNALRDEIRRLPPSDIDVATETWFHREMAAIFTSLRDRHTIYRLPDPYASHIACLPFLIERCAIGSESEYVVSKVAPRLGFRDFKQLYTGGDGSEAPIQPRVFVTRWNGMPIEDAIELNGELNAGANPEARRARGLERLTFRWLGLGPEPIEDWMVLSYQLGDGRERHARFPWLVIQRDDRVIRRDDRALPAASRERAVDDEGSWIDFEKSRLLSDPPPEAHPGIVVCRPIEGRDYGYLRIHSFPADEHFIDTVRETVRKAEAVRKAGPFEGLVIDLRDNPGGHIPTAERLLEELRAGAVRRATLEFRNTADCKALAERFIATTGADSVVQREIRADARAAGAAYFPSPPAAEPPRAAQDDAISAGPFALIIDALTYSAAEIFAAGFQDHQLGPIIGTAAQTGGGGANVWSYATVIEFADAGKLAPLPLRTSFEVAIRRATRVGDEQRNRAGIGIEGVGVRVSGRHKMTARDIFEKNEDLIAQAVHALDELRSGGTHNV